MSSIEDSVKSAFSEALWTSTKRVKSHSYRIMRRPRFRGSSLPICKRNFVLSTILMDTSETPLTEPNDTPYSEYFLSEGTLIHRLLQKYTGLGNISYGYWQCLNPQCPNRTGSDTPKIIGPKLGSGFCCGAPMEYIEFEVKRKWFSGHIDFIVKINNKYYVIDFKTSKSAWDKNFKIPNNYYHQLNSYFWWVTENCDKIGIPQIDGALLVFVPRDYYFLSPNKWKVIPIAPKRSVWESDYNDCKEVRKCIKKKSLKLFKTFEILDKSNCMGEYDNKCWLFDICHSKKEKSIVKEYFKKWK